MEAYLSNPIWVYVLSMCAYICALLLIVHVMRKFPRFALVFWLLALLSFPLWSDYVHGWFRWAKTLSVLVPTAIFVGFGRYAELTKKENWLKIFRGDWILWFLYGILFLNILEATVKDIQCGYYFNGISGIVLLITQPLVKYKHIQRKFWGIGEGSSGDLLVWTNAMWNFLYTTWNLAFVYGEAQGFFFSSVCILLAAELYPLIMKRPELYITARVYTLATHILVRAVGANALILTFMNADKIAGRPEVIFWWGFINMMLHIPYLVYYFWKINRLKKCDVAMQS